MAKLLSYSLSGKGIAPEKSTFFFSLIKKAGVIFPPRPHFGNTGGKLYFHSTEPIGEKTEQAIIELLKKHGVNNPRIELCGNYIKS